VLWTLFVILLIAWILGLVGVYQIGSLLWLLLVAAVVVLAIQLVTGRRAVISRRSDFDNPGLLRGCLFVFRR